MAANEKLSVKFDENSEAKIKEKSYQEKFAEFTKLSTRK